MSKSRICQENYKCKYDLSVIPYCFPLNLSSFQGSLFNTRSDNEPKLIRTVNKDVHHVFILFLSSATNPMVERIWLLTVIAFCLCSQRTWPSSQILCQGYGSCFGDSSCVMRINGHYIYNRNVYELAPMMCYGDKSNGHDRIRPRDGKTGWASFIIAQFLADWLLEGVLW